MPTAPTPVSEIDRTAPRKNLQSLVKKGARAEHPRGFARLRARDRVDDDEPRVEVPYDEMTFFTHQVNGQTYGGWYRQLAPHEIEIMGAGLLCKTNYAGCDELSVARSVLEEFVRMQLRTGGDPRPLDSPGQRDNTPR